MQFVQTVMLIVHIIGGIMAMVTGLVSMLNRKGASQHRLTGKLFFAGMTAVFVTSCYISIVKSLPFLFMVGFFSYHMACSGYRILYLKKKNTSQSPGLIDWVISSSGLLAGIGLILYSAYWFQLRGAWGLVPLAFGISCCLNSTGDIRSYFHPHKDKRYWIKTHGARMGGSFAATITAFVVVNFSLGSYTWILWILPGVLIGIWISRTIKRYPKSKIPVEGKSREMEQYNIARLLSKDNSL